jgi:hypothetical protein
VKGKSESERGSFFGDVRKFGYLIGMGRAAPSLGAGKEEGPTAGGGGLAGDTVRGLLSFSAYVKSLKLFDRLAWDMKDLSGRFELSKLVSQ